MTTGNREQKFYSALRDVFVGAKVEGESGYINLMRIKSRYYEKGVFPELSKDINAALKPFPQFREELFDKLYTFFSRYFSESGSIYFRYTPLHQNVYERVYTDDKDVMLFWKTHMLYYVKTDRLFKNLEVELDGQKLFFDVSGLEHKKANEKRELIYAFKEKRKDNVLAFTVAYSERGRKTNTTDILRALRQAGATVGEEMLERAFRVFERQSEVDYFINKNAKAFLEEQFNLWLYQYVFTGESAWTEQRIRQLQVLKDIAFKIIAFISQFEDELVKVWNKPKFVLNSNYVITLSRIGERDGGMAVVEKLLAHDNFKAQVTEWRELGIVDESFKKSQIIEKDLTGKRLVERWQHLPVDTKHFKDVELEILGLFDNLDEALDGRLIKSENYQALNTACQKFAQRIQGIYIDPPYNAEATEILYQNSFKHSSWLAMMQDRVALGKSLLRSEGILCVTIDDYEASRLQLLLDDLFGTDNRLATIAIRNNPSGRSTVSGFAINHEYALIYAESLDDAEVGRFPHTEEQRQRYDEVAAAGERHFEWENFRKNSTGSFRSDRPRQYYPIYFDQTAPSLRLPKMEWQNTEKSWLIQEQPHKSETAIWPLDDSERERVWRWGVERTGRSLSELKVKIRDGRPEIYKVKFLQEQGSLPRTWWDNPAYSARDNGTRALVDLFGSEKAFDFPKAPRAVEDSLRVCAVEDGHLVLDFFGGSGTTIQATMNLNREDDGSRRYVVVEMGGHFDAVIVPRVKKLAFTDKWRDGQPQEGGKGISHFVKYYRLEQYEDALRRVKYDDADLFSDPSKDAYNQYVFLRDLKMLAALDVDAKKNKVKVDLSKLYDGIDVAETLSNLTGKWIKRVTADEVEFADGEKVDLKNLDYRLIKPLIWW